MIKAEVSSINYPQTNFLHEPNQEEEMKQNVIERTLNPSSRVIVGSRFVIG